MKVTPSIAFSDFSGTAKEVTARKTKNRIVLSVRAKQPATVTPAQAVSRAKLAKISRAYKKLTAKQMKDWENLAAQLKTNPVLGSSIKLTAHNAFVRVNSNLALIGQSMVSDAPALAAAVPSVQYSDFWLNTSTVLFSGIEQPEGNYRLVAKMSNGLSTGVSSASAKAVIVESGVESDWGELDLTEAFGCAYGMAPIAGQKYFFELYWVDADSGFVGQPTMVSAICSDGESEHDQAYVPRVRVRMKDVKESDGIKDIDMEVGTGSTLSVNVDFTGEDGVSAAEMVLNNIVFPEKLYTMVMGRAYADNDYKPMTFVMWSSTFTRDNEITFAYRGGDYEKPCEVFGTGIIYN